MMAETEGGWLIEDARSEACEPSYWAGGPGRWTRDHNTAVRFARQEDADRVAQNQLRSIPTRVCEHGWG